MIPDHGFGEPFWLDIREKFLRLDTEIFSDSDSVMPDVVTHYTSLEGLNGIIGRQEIWCTDIRRVNDPHEGDYGMAVIQNVITRKSVPSPFADVVMRQERLFGTKELFTNYIACFCAVHDTGAMWQNYAQGGSGYGIVFDSQTLLGASDGGRLYSLAPLIYDEQVQHGRTARVIDGAIQLQRKLQIPTRAFPRFWFHEVLFYLLVCGSRFKDPIWRHEQEIRMSISSGRENLNEFEHTGRTRVAVPFNRAAIVRIVRGGNRPSDAVPPIRDLLNSAGFDAGLPIL